MSLARVCQGLLAAGLAVSAVAAAPVVGKVANSGDWLRGVIPLPHEVAITEQVTLPAREVRIVLREGSGAPAQTGWRGLQALFREKAGVDGGAGAGFEITLGLCDTQGRLGDLTVPDAARLQELPNRSQAYLIRPIGKDRLVLAALDSRGLYYAALTLRQMLEPRFHGDLVDLPLATITDWPDLAERGEWGGSSVRDLEWLAERKMNLVEFHSEHSVDAQGKASASLDPALLRRGELHGVTMVPIISHLNGIGSRGAYKAYPELQGKGKAAVYADDSVTLIAPCASHPKLREILAAWMCGFAAAGDVRDISCWLGELRQRCECEECAKTGQFALETRAFVEAWREARKTYPDLRIRILLTQGSYDSNDKVLAEIPPEVGVTYYDGGRTYDSSPQPMIYPLLQDYAAKGGWLGCYPQLTPSWRIVSPWSCPQFIRFRLTEFVDKKLTSLGGYVVPDNRLFDFNVTAAAEWSWNAHGRSERDFALAWATRQGCAEPEAVADWAMLLGPVSWDLYGARLVERYLFHPDAFRNLISARAKVPFQKGFLGLIRDREQLQRNRQACVEALRLARQAGPPTVLAESEAILSYYDMVIAICDLCDTLAGKAAITPATRRLLQDQMNRLALVGGLNLDALADWERAAAVGAGGGRFRECLEATANTVQAVAVALEPYGVRNPNVLMMGREIGRWTVEDFRESARISREWEVTNLLAGPGTYLVTFHYTAGWNGLNPTRAALLAVPAAGAATARRELSVDAHPGVTGHRSTGNTYRLALEAYDPGCRYLVAATVSGTRPQDQAEGRTGCSGVVRLQRERDPDWQTRVLQVEPLADGEVPSGLKTAFSGQGIRVGVVVGGYGSESLLRLLAKEPGLDAVAVPGGDLRLSECQVLILPQFRSDMAPTDLVSQLEAYVQAGGGLISTHDAVGYRQMPALLTSVCKGGSGHVREENWKISGTHPVTAGLAPDATLAQAYFDHVEIEAGPAGSVVAVSEKSGRPVLVVGEPGKGRYVACGLLPGFSADAQEAPPTADEARLLLNAVRWCARAR